MHRAEEIVCGKLVVAEQINDIVGYLDLGIDADRGTAFRPAIRRGHEDD
jgi:hypothetical protein